MLQIHFDAKIWKQGNSLILTIPKEVRTAHNLKENDHLRVFANLMTEEQLKQEHELKRIRTLYPHTATGMLIHDNEEVAQLQEVYFQIHEIRAGTLALGESFDKLPIHRKLYGIILRGVVLPIAYENKHYGQYPLEDGFIQKNLTYTETIELKTPDGREIIVSNISFEKPIMKKGIPVLDKIEFSGDFIEKVVGKNVK